MSNNIIINAITPRVQFIAAGGQTVFAYPFAIFEDSDLQVFKTPNGAIASDTADLLTLTVNYTVQNNVAPAVGGTITLNVGANVGDIITIIRNMPEQRLSNYQPGGDFAAENVNADFDSSIMMIQTNTMFQEGATPQYNVSAVVNQNADIKLPVLGALQSWRKNETNTGFEAFTVTPNAITVPTEINAIPKFVDTNGGMTSSNLYAVGHALQFWNAGLTAFTSFQYDGNTNLNYSWPSSRALGQSLTYGGQNNIVFSNLSGRNLLINGDFQIWQSGNTFVNDTAINYRADMWQSGPVANTTSVTELLYIQSPAPQVYNTYFGIGRTNNGTNNIIVSQSVARLQCTGMQGKPLSFQFKGFKGANFSSAGNILTVTITTGTGVPDVSNAPTYTGFLNPVVILTQNFVLTNAPVQYFTLTNAVPVNAVQVEVRFQYTPVGALVGNDAFYISDVKLEISDTPTVFERKSFYDSLDDCRRYWSSTYTYGILPGTANQPLGARVAFQSFTTNPTQASARNYVWQYPASMISAPNNVTMYNVTAPINVGNWEYFVSGVNQSMIALAQNETSMIIQNNGALTDAGDFLYGHIVADCRLV